MSVRKKKNKEFRQCYIKIHVQVCTTDLITSRNQKPTKKLNKNKIIPIEIHFDFLRRFNVNQNGSPSPFVCILKQIYLT